MAVTARHEHFTPPAFQASPMFRARVSPRIMRADVMPSHTTSLTHQRISCLPEKDAPHHVHPAATSTGTTGTRGWDLPCVWVQTSVQAAQWNIQANARPNVRIARLSAEEYTQAMQGERSFRRLREQEISLAEHDFSTL